MIDLVTGFILCLVALVLIFGLRIFFLASAPSAPEKKDDDHKKPLAQRAPPAPANMGDPVPPSQSNPAAAVSPTSAKPVRRARRED
eukprot:CAMPEP_0174829342 /NCGR_PEP_ID=MMETSP1114-20130205/1881_1 /TAXON_ID=312471 /ORGANISM="Neobodo designis, Strain CCAP 1951/1" /LENGTH=85 /DNA_ID=CAMNT_0016063087 /DNA_START=42 /DNA_END=299 /DNA_ORIENTATION=+